MHILLLAATFREIEPTVLWLRARAASEAGNRLQFDQLTVEVLFTGVGLTATAFALGDRFAAEGLPTLAIQAGVGGALDRTLSLGEVVQVTSERFGDLGAEDRDGTFLSLADIGLAPGPPFDEREVLHAPPAAASLPFRRVAGLSVNRVSGTAGGISILRGRWSEAQVESMEGAAFLFACAKAGVEPLQLRAISNYVEPRNRAAWQMGKAITALNEQLQALLGAFIG